jgi:tetratricopeptide (TPR) repeat protein
MVGLAERLSWAFCGSSQQQLEEMLQREDWLALGECYEASNHPKEAETAYRRAIELLRDPHAKADAFQRLGNLLKGQQRWTEAMELWQYWLTSVPGLDPTPYIELAKCCEWHLRDLEQAEMWTAWALHNLHTASARRQPPGALADLEHRLTRLKRKRGAAG